MTTDTLVAAAALALLAGGAEALPAIGLTGKRTLVCHHPDPQPFHPAPVRRL